MKIHDYLATVATQLVSELTPILDIKEVTSNTDLLGKYTEATIRSLVHRIVQPMRVSTGAVIDYPMPEVLRQIDLIVWAPFPVPAIFEVDGFGLVPKSSAFGVIEVKRSNYPEAIDKLESFLADVESQKIIAAYENKVSSFQDSAMSPGIGIVCVLTAAPSARLQKLIALKRVVAIFERNGDKTAVRSKDVFVLVNFLHFVSWRYRTSSANSEFPQVNLGLLP